MNNNLGTREREAKAIDLAVAQGDFTDGVKVLEKVATELRTAGLAIEGEDFETVRVVIDLMMKRRVLHMRASGKSEIDGCASARYVKGPDMQ